MRRGFASDNYAGVHPEVLDAIAAVNEGHAPAYGADAVTETARDRFREHFGPQADAFPVFNGSGSNVTSIAALTRSHHAVICAATAHLNVDECGGPERIAGIKLLALDTPDGKLTPELLESGVAWSRVGDEHASQPRLVSITNSTELGTVYTPEEVSAIADFVHGRKLLLHMDGARICNAAAALDVPLRALTTDAGVDVLSFGGTKNGLLAAEAVVFLTEGLGDEFTFVRKQSMQLASKMRFVSAQLAELLRDDLWRRSAAHANEMAALLGEAIGAIDGVELSQTVQANGVFAVLPAAAIERLEVDADGNRAFYVWDESSREVRLMCSWDTTPEDVEGFAARMVEVLAAGSNT